MTLRQEGGKTLITPSGGSGGDATIIAPLGSQPAASSVSVAIASDQLPLPVLATIDTTGLATSANQDTEIARLTSILAQLDVALSTRASEATLLGVLTSVDFQARINTLGQKTSATSTPVVLASDQSVIPVNTKTDLTPSAPTAASVGVTSAQILAANASRKGLILVNTSDNRISLGFGSPAVLDSGATLYPQGAFNMAEYDFDLSAVNAIASVAGSNISIQEYI